MGGDRGEFKEVVLIVVGVLLVLTTILSSLICSSREEASRCGKVYGEGTTKDRRR